ncbi:MAG: hypothetical protein ACYCRH_04695 [Acidiferrobacteraceae bacterium]
MNNRAFLGSVLLLASVLGGCASLEPKIYDVRAALLPLSGAPARLDQVARAILRAGTSLGWQMQRVGRHDISGVFDVYRAQAVVDVHFTRHDYAIRYRASRHLDVVDGHIETRYNTWVRSLSRQINFEAACIGRIQCRQAI